VRPSAIAALPDNSAAGAAEDCILRRESLLMDMNFFQGIDAARQDLKGF
jgi:hypothetical protein